MSKNIETLSIIMPLYKDYLNLIVIYCLKNKDQLQNEHWSLLFDHQIFSIAYKINLLGPIQMSKHTPFKVIYIIVMLAFYLRLYCML